MPSEQDRLRVLESLHAAWQEALAHEQQARAAFLDVALEELWASGQRDEAALWRAQAAFGDEAQGKCAGYLAGRLGLMSVPQEDADG